jgi:hypothetical protein
MRRILLKQFALIVAPLLLLPGLAEARSGGIDSSEMQDGPATCSSAGVACHGAASNEVFVTISGPEELLIDEIVAYRIEIFESVQGGLQAGAGLNIAAFIDQVLTDIDDGILDENAANTKLTETPIHLDTGQITHVNARSQNADGSLAVFSYDFTVVAPSDPASLTLIGAMNSFNDSGNQLGDKWSQATLVVTVPEPRAGLPAAVALATVGIFRRRFPSAC